MTWNRTHINLQGIAMKFDLHIHSKYSHDCRMEPLKILKIARKIDLNGIAVVDHNTVLGGVKTSRMRDEDMFVIIGSEIWTPHGEIIGLFLNEEIKSQDYPEVIDEIKGQGGISVLPHPYRKHQKFPDDVVGKVDVIEIFNARDEAWRNIRANALATATHMPVTAGSDAHLPRFIGRGAVESGDIVSEEDLRKAIIKKNISTRGKELGTIERLVDTAYRKIVKSSVFSAKIPPPE